MIETFTVPARIKKIALGLIIVGILGVIVGFVANQGHTTQIWANLLICSYYTTGICLGATFFLATHQIGYGGWHILLRRVPEAFSALIPISGVLLLVAALGGAKMDDHLYSWMHPAANHLVGEELETLGKKSGFLNFPFFALRLVCYVALWSLTSFMMRYISRKEDEVGVQSTYKSSKYYAAAFILVFAVTESTGAWDFIMSTNPLWYSTLFGWYNFASYTVAGFSSILLLTLYLKRLGYLQRVNEDHIHNIGMFMFGFSVFWTYLWFSQFMLIWYANIPEETHYFSIRFDRPFFKFLFFVNLFLNFVVPFLFLMRRSAKRNYSRIGAVAVVLIIGHFIDFYMMVVPNVTDPTSHTSISGLFITLATALGFVGLFLVVVLNALTKASLTPVNNPYLKESIQHHTIK